MEEVISALKELDQLYGDIESQVFGDRPASDRNDAAALSDSVLRNQHLIARLNQAEASLSGLASRWHRRRDRTSEEERERVAALAETVRTRVSALLKCCEDRASHLKACMLRLEDELIQVRQGVRYMRSSRASRVNYPKFIDSHG